MSEVETAIDKLRHHGISDKGLTAVQATLAVIPWAGGALSTVLGENRSAKAATKVADAFEALHRVVKDQGVELSEVLDEDQVVEVVHSTVEEIVKSSDSDKIRYLKNAMINSFTDGDIKFAEKQTYLAILKTLTIPELGILNLIYLSGDPFEETLDVPQPGLSGSDSAILAATDYRSSLRILSYTYEYREPQDGNTLHDVITSTLGDLQPGLTNGVISILDSKGLTEILPNVDRRTVKRQIPVRNSQDATLYVSDYDRASLALGSPEPPRSTPIEASRTEFGRQFIQYIS